MSEQLKANGCDLYLRDLRAELQLEIIREWKREKNKKLLEANELGKDIIVGKFGEQGLESEH